MITAVLPVWVINEQVLKLTEQAVESLKGTPLIVIDNASPMGGGWLRSIADIYVRNKENLGFAKACNQGIKLAQTDYVAIASNDTRPSPNWKEVAEEVLKQYNVFSCHFRMTNYDVPFKYGDKIWYGEKERWCTAAFFVLNKKYNLYFDENFFNSFEDWSLFLEARQRGLYTAYTNLACFQHNHSFTQKLVGFPKSDENRKYFIEKHGKDPDVLLAEMYPDQMREDYYGGFDL